MPIYEYRCEKCGVFELTQRISDPPAQRCPKCRRKVQRLISQTSFQLKGSGWYVTDYARKGTAPGAATTDGAAAGGGDGKKVAAADGGTDSSSAKKKADGGAGKPATAGAGSKS